MAEKRRISNIHRYAISLSNCPKLSDNPRITTVEYTVESKVGMYFDAGHSEKIAHSECDISKNSRKAGGQSEPSNTIAVIL